MRLVFGRLLATLGRAAARVHAWFEPPLDADARPLEIREAIIDRVEHQATSLTGDGQRLPHARLSVTVVAPDAPARAALQTALAGIEEAIRTRLGEIRCPVPAGFAVEVRYIRKPRRDWAEGQRFDATFDRRPPADIAGAAADAPLLRLRVIRGRAARTAYALAEPTVLIGRTAMPTDHRGRPRHNHVAFLEDAAGDAHGATVGRAHASIRYDAARGEYRLFDDGSHNGTRIVRGGETIPVSSRDPVGVTLRSGDEVQFGTAAVRVEIGGSGAR